MEVVLKRKNIDLPVDILQKLSLVAISQSKSLKAYIEDILISKANSISVSLNDSPSPSGDKWFDNPENMQSVNRGRNDVLHGRTKVYSMDDVKNVLGV